MSRNAYAKSQIFLLEFIIVVLFFAICATVCVSAFIKADRLSVNSREQNRAVIEMQSAAECIKTLSAEALKGDPVVAAADALAQNIGATGPLLTVDGQNRVSVYFDEDFRPVGSDNAEYEVFVDLSVEGDILVANITSSVMDKEDVLTVKKYIPGKE